MRKLELWGKSQQKLEVLLEPLSESEIEQKKGRKEKEREKGKKGRKVGRHIWIPGLHVYVLPFCLASSPL